MSIFASEITATVALPFDVPHTVTIKKLNGGAIEAAQSAHLNATVAGRSPRGWEARFRKLLGQGTSAEIDAALADPLNGFDRQTIVARGLTAWSYTVTDDKGVEKPRPINVSDLDDEAMEFIALEILKLTKPGLFQTAEEREAARKNG